MTTQTTQEKKQYFNYKVRVFNRKTHVQLYTFSIDTVLTEQEAIDIQVDLSTPEKLFLLEKLI